MMAYFERQDEFKKLIRCNICGVNMKESGITAHKAKCITKPDQKAKFEKGLLERCPYSIAHIVEGGKMNIHLEFCTKRQAQLLAEYQSSMRQDDDSQVVDRMASLGLE